MNKITLYEADIVTRHIQRVRILKYAAYSTIVIFLLDLAMFPVFLAIKVIFNLDQVSEGELLTVFGVDFHEIKYLLIVFLFLSGYMLHQIVNFQMYSAHLSSFLILIVLLSIFSEFYFYDITWRPVGLILKDSVALIVLISISVIVRLFWIRCLLSIVISAYKGYVINIKSISLDLKHRIFEYFGFPLYLSRLSGLKIIFCIIFSVLAIRTYGYVLYGYNGLNTKVEYLVEMSIHGGIEGCRRGHPSKMEFEACVESVYSIRENPSGLIYFILLSGPLLFFILTRVFISISQFIGRIDVDKARRNDKRTPVLYLRPFAFEGKKIKNRRRDPIDWLFDVTGQRKRIEEIALEEFTRIGPVIGLGNPNDKWQPSGIARQYTENEYWKNRFLHYLKESKKVIVIFKKTENIIAEVGEIKNHGRISDTIFMFPNDVDYSDIIHLSVLLEINIEKVLDEYKMKKLFCYAMWIDYNGKINIAVSCKNSSENYTFAIRTFLNQIYMK